MSGTLSTRRLLVLLPLFALVGLFLSGCPAPDWPKCENDDHCQADKDDNPTGKAYVCVFGQCQECGRDADCSAGETCQSGRCESGCVSDDECGDGESCNERGKCVTSQSAAQDPNACVEDGDCQSGFTCVDKRCAADTAASLQCEREMRVQFGFNVYDLTPEAREVLDNFAKCMQQNGEWRLTIEGHADERGTTQYNLDLGEKRARSVADYLGRLGVQTNRLRTVSYGEERPVDPSSTEEAWAQNRRGVLVIK